MKNKLLLSISQKSFHEFCICNKIRLNSSAQKGDEIGFVISHGD